MSSFDSYNDTPNQIKNEGQNISLKFERIGESAGRISWNIPSPSQGCSSENQAYNGIIITLDRTHTNASKSPINGTVYEADNVIDTDLHVGDSIDTSLVIGAFYNDKTTTFLDITDLNENEAYYISGFAVDLQNRYHTQGVHAYSLDVINSTATDDKPGCQSIKLSEDDIVLTDIVNLDPIIYDFDITYNVPDLTALQGETGIITTYNYIPSNSYQQNLEYTSISIDWSTNTTFDELLNSINFELKKLNNPFVSTIPPNTNQYYWNSVDTTLFQWDGFTHIEQNIIYESTDPVIRSIGDLWFDQFLLNEWDGSNWNIIQYIKYHKDLNDLDCTDYWFNGSSIYNWTGDVWCTTVQYIQSNDPAISDTLECGSFWYNEDTLLLNKLSPDNTWVNSDVIYWHEALDNLSVGTLWYKDSTNELFEYDGITFNQISVVNIEPTNPIIDDHWYDVDNETMFYWSGLEWLNIAIINNETDPTDINSCDVFWNLVNDILYIWDITTLSWDNVSTFIQSEIDPLIDPIIEINSTWFNNGLFVWDGMQWNDANVITYNTDPTLRVLDEIVYIDSIWNRWNGTSWDSIEIIESSIEPTSGTLPLNTIWFNSANNTLQLWNGLSWIQVAYSSTSLTPINDTLWLDTNDNELKSWYKSEWKIIKSDVIASYEDGNIKFCSSLLGHASNVIINESTDNLFRHIFDDIIYGRIIQGTDGVSDVPLYQQLGVGTDGNPDVRKELATTLMQQLGYPTVEVELSKAQIDIAIDSGIEEIRKRTGIGYKRGYFFLDMQPGQQRYMMTNRGNGFNKIVQIMGIFRTTSSFLAGFDNGVFGQSAINFLYSSQGYDLVSYHLYSSYVEELETLFATKIMYQFNEQARTLDILQSGYRSERVLLDVSVERTEQDLIQDRQLRSWIEGWALAQCMLILSQIRGKYGSLPGANGVSLNAGELYAQAQDMMNVLLLEIDDFVVETPEEYGLNSSILLG